MNIKTLENLKENGVELNSIYNCDCLDMLKYIEDKSIDLLYTDPPYNQSFSGKGSLAKKYDYRKDEIKKISNFDPTKFLKIVKSKFKIFNAYIWTSKNLLKKYIEFAEENKYNWNLLIWNKLNPIPAYNYTYLPDVEYCIFIRESGAHWTKGLGYKTYRKVMSENVAKNSHGHPTQKYLWMIEKAIQISSKKNDLIFDPFAGSFTTSIACENLKRNWIACDVEKKYCEIGEKRLNNFYKQPMLL